MIKSNLKTILKSAKGAIENGSENVNDAFRLAVKKIDKAVAKGIIHKNKAANKKSKLQILYNKVR